jgi:hypothetical protein
LGQDSVYFDAPGQYDVILDVSVAISDLFIGTSTSQVTLHVQSCQLTVTNRLILDSMSGLDVQTSSITMRGPTVLSGSLKIGGGSSLQVNTVVQLPMYLSISQSTLQGSFLLVASPKSLQSITFLNSQLTVTAPTTWTDQVTFINSVVTFSSDCILNLNQLSSISRSTITWNQNFNISSARMNVTDSTLKFSGKSNILNGIWIGSSATVQNYGIFEIVSSGFQQMPPLDGTFR